MFQRRRPQPATQRQRASLPLSPPTRVALLVTGCLSAFIWTMPNGPDATSPMTAINQGELGYGAHEFDLGLISLPRPESLEMIAPLGEPLRLNLASSWTYDVPVQCIGWQFGPASIVDRLEAPPREAAQLIAEAPAARPTTPGRRNRLTLAMPMVRFFEPAGPLWADQDSNLFIDRPALCEVEPAWMFINENLASRHVPRTVRAEVVTGIPEIMTLLAARTSASHDLGHAQFSGQQQMALRTDLEKPIEPLMSITAGVLLFLVVLVPIGGAGGASQGSPQSRGPP